MAKRNCRDCPACTRSGLARLGKGLVNVSTLGMSAAATAAGRSVMKNCPDCGHALGRHQRRGDGAFVD